ncbi:Pup--protein ligase [Kitasatospora sp. NPDC048540]|uniref:Pup--protein ligase n=1 Tax=Kitasatospora sp. NPDC048540 TaxID=3155634 RepID=UPI0033E8C724
MSATPVRRLFGLENEYGLICTSPPLQRPMPDEIARRLFRHLAWPGHGTNLFLPNGSRFYLDIGAHPEYATPECDDLRELVTHDKAGERIIEGLIEKTEQQMRRAETPGSIYAFKNNTDSDGHSYGCHENYLIRRESDFPGLVEKMLPFLVTRQLICGAGRVVKTVRGARFSVSQRAEFICESSGSSTTRSRPIVNTRDEPHADSGRYRRLHVIVGDANMSETTTLLKVGATDLILRLIESGAKFRGVGVRNPVRAIHEISLDPTGRHLVPLTNGRQASALEIQEEYFTQAMDFVEAEGSSDPSVHKVLDLWGRTLDAIRTGDLGRVSTEIDWIIKQRLIERYREKHGLGLDDPRIAQIDLAYHDIHRRRGLFYLLQNKGQAARVTTDIEVFRAKSVPPQTTRARLRGDFIRAAREHDCTFNVDWVQLRLDIPPHPPVSCKEPFASVDERVELLIQKIRTADLRAR